MRSSALHGQSADAAGCGSSAIAIVGLWLIGAAGAHAATATAVEYYNAALNHYSISIDDREIRAADAGVNPSGWVRTGGEFTVWTDPAYGRLPVCRIFGTPDKSIDSGFSTADMDECAGVKRRPASTLQAATAFYLQ